VGFHKSKPDLDNLLKAFTDALWEEDQGIWSLSATKMWGEAGAIWVRRIRQIELPKEVL
jgi:Holliday junction resolvase RusA-like endonuclease